MGSQKRDNGEVVFQHVWKTTRAAGKVGGPQMSWWYPVKGIVLVVWFFAAIDMMLGTSDLTTLQFCVGTMFTGLCAILLPDNRRRRYSIDRDSFHPNKF